MINEIKKNNTKKNNNYPNLVRFPSFPYIEFQSYQNAGIPIERKRTRTDNFMGLRSPVKIRICTPLVSHRADRHGYRAIPRKCFTPVVVWPSWIKLGPIWSIATTTPRTYALTSPTTFFQSRSHVFFPLVLSPNPPFILAENFPPCLHLARTTTGIDRGAVSTPMGCKENRAYRCREQAENSRAASPLEIPLLRDCAIHFSSERIKREPMAGETGTMFRCTGHVIAVGLSARFKGNGASLIGQRVLPRERFVLGTYELIGRFLNIVTGLRRSEGDYLQAGSIEV